MNSSETTLEDFYVVDTHALIWHLTSEKPLGKQPEAIFAAAERGETKLLVSAITIAEMYYANKKNRWFENFKETYQQLVSKPYIRLVDFKADHTLDFDQDMNVPEMHDRIIAGLARRIKAPLLTIDPLIKADETLRIIWN
jgi:PIN domain nuclease of toxin-antitoxin system